MQGGPRDRRARLRYGRRERSDRTVNEFGRNSLRNGPDERGRFGEYGGRFVAETLMPLILEVEQAYLAARADPAFRKELDAHLKHYVVRPSALGFPAGRTGNWGGERVFSKRENLTHPASQRGKNSR